MRQSQRIVVPHFAVSQLTKTALCWLEWVSFADKAAKQWRHTIIVSTEITAVCIKPQGQTSRLNRHSIPLRQCSSK
ncbi:unnamed protein product [Ceratitis capitata]|uniref:(Mediterranean fruit fly) hypothetical protein n=1 Tax=Ceratitis capitata TaxID=7213 RepID=A0A811UY83_CERCA|nr:unnamed protein product [Ceratitis capitata]